MFAVEKRRQRAGSSPAAVMLLIVVCWELRLYARYRH
jgi:hypothetical protein